MRDFLGTKSMFIDTPAISFSFSLSRNVFVLFFFFHCRTLSVLNEWKIETIKTIVAAGTKPQNYVWKFIIIDVRRLKSHYSLMPVNCNFQFNRLLGTVFFSVWSKFGGCAAQCSLIPVVFALATHSRFVSISLFSLVFFLLFLLGEIQLKILSLFNHFVSVLLLAFNGEHRYVFALIKNNQTTRHVPLFPQIKLNTHTKHC